MKHLPTYLLFATIAAFSAGCKKDDESKPAPTKTELLTAKSWRVTADVSTETANGRTTTTDNFATYDACEKDNFIKFGTDKKAIFDEGALKCPGADQTETGVWDFNSDQTKLTLGAAGSSVVGQFDIAELSATTFKINQTTTFSGTMEIETITFTAF